MTTCSDRYFHITILQTCSWGVFYIETPPLYYCQKKLFFLRNAIEVTLEIVGFANKYDV